MSEPIASPTARQPRVLRNPRALRWTWVVGLAVMVAVGLVLLLLLTQATTHRDMYEQNYARLFILNVVVAGALLGVILWIAYRLLKRLRQGKFGSRLLVKLAAVFALAGFAQITCATCPCGQAIPFQGCNCQSCKQTNQGGGKAPGNPPPTH